MKYIYWYIFALLRVRHNVALEIMILKQQLSIASYKRKRFNFSKIQKLFFILLSRLLSSWKEYVFIVKPETIVKWHRKGFKLFWRWKSRNPGRPRIAEEIRKLIKKMKCENVNWGAPSIWAELIRLGFHISLPTVQNYLKWFGRHKPKNKGNQKWLTFLRNHMIDVSSMDLFVIPTITYNFLYVFVILSHDRRKIIHWNVTKNPTQNWVYLQIINAYAFDENKVPKYMIHDRDVIFKYKVQGILESLKIESVKTSFRSPWQNCYCERVIGIIKHDVLNHVIILNEDHFRKIMSEYIEYYINYRTHSSLNGNSPIAKRNYSEHDGKVKSISMVGGTIVRLN